MVRQLTNKQFCFSYMYIKPLYQHGDKPTWDQSGAVSHLLPTKKYLDQMALTWIKKNNISVRFISNNDRQMYDIFEFERDEDAVLFKISWL